MKHDFGMTDEEAAEFETTVRGNPANPTGEDGVQMLMRMNESHRGLRNWVLSFIEPLRILDIGCGSGGAVYDLAIRYPSSKVYGIDISEISVELSKKTCSVFIKNGQVEIKKESVEDLSFKDNFFNLIISIESYFFWEDLDTALAEIYRVLAPGGTLLLASEDNQPEEALTEKVQYLRERFNYNRLSDSDFMDLLTKHHFVDVKIHKDDQHHWLCMEAHK